MQKILLASNDYTLPAHRLRKAYHEANLQMDFSRGIIMTKKEYQHILLAVELEPGCDSLPAQKALHLAQQFEAQLTIVNAVEPLISYGVAYGIAVGDIEQTLLENAKEAMSSLGRKLGVPESHQIIKIGPAKVVILEEAERLNVDLIVVGSHGRHGVRLLLGSTANSVLHGTKRDVLAVRIPDEQS